MYGTANRREFEEAARQVVEDSLYLREHPDADEIKLQRSNSLRRRLAADVAKAAMNHAIANEQDVDAFEWLANSGLEVINGLEYSLTEHLSFSYNENEKPVVNWNFWRHVDQPYQRIKAKDFPYLNRLGVEEDAYNYLNLTYRAPLLERTIVDVLIATELFAFSKEMFEKPHGEFPSNKSPMNEKHALRQYFRNLLIGAALFLGPAFVAAAFGPPVIGQTASDWTAGILVALFVLELVTSTVSLPFAWRHQRRAKKRVIDLINLMVNTYAELSGNGDVSTRRLREVAARAADAGVVWPKPLFLVLDDNIARIGRL